MTKEIIDGPIPEIRDEQWLAADKQAMYDRMQAANDAKPLYERVIVKSVMSPLFAVGALAEAVGNSYRFIKDRTYSK